MDVFGEIYRQYEADVRRFLYRLTGCDSQLTEELTQETFYRAFLSFGKFRGVCQMRTWLCSIAKHVYARFIRNEAKQRTLAEHAVPAPAQSLPEQTEQKEMLLAVYFLCDTPKNSKDITGEALDADGNVLLRLRTAGALGYQYSDAQWIWDFVSPPESWTYYTKRR